MEHLSPGVFSAPSEEIPQADQERQAGKMSRLKGRIGATYAGLATRLMVGNVPGENDRKFFHDDDGNINKRRVAAAAALGTVGALGALYAQQKGVEVDLAGLKNPALKVATKPLYERASGVLDAKLGLQEGTSEAIRAVGTGVLAIAGTVLQEGIIADGMNTLTEHLDRQDSTDLAAVGMTSTGLAQDRVMGKASMMVS
jgi:hypothetical protein